MESFIVSPGSVDSPIVFNNAFQDASPGPTTGPIHTYHLGLWFNDPNDAGNPGCPNTVTPFNGEHDAGIQALNTSDFQDLQGHSFGSDSNKLSEGKTPSKSGQAGVGRGDAEARLGLP